MNNNIINSITYHFLFALVLYSAIIKFELNRNDYIYYSLFDGILCIIHTIAQTYKINTTTIAANTEPNTVTYEKTWSFSLPKLK